MSEKLPIALVIFSCTVPKLGRDDYYQLCINNLAQNIDLDLFPFKLLSVKFRPNEKDIAGNYKVWAKEKGFEVILNQGEWVNGEIGKTQEYIKDYIKVYHNDQLNQFPFTFEIEDDVTLHLNQRKLEDYLIKSVQLLVENKDLLAIRWTDREDEYQRINRLNAKYGWTNKKAIKLGENDEFFLDSDHLTFRNYLVRTRDMFQATRLLYHNFDKLHPSAETSVTNALLALTDYDTPFVCWEPTLGVHKHMFIPD